MSSQVSKWSKFFVEAGVPGDPANTYAVIFYDHRIQEDMLPDLSKEILRDMGITVMGDIIAILRHGREVHAQSERERTAKAMAVTEDPVPLALSSSPGTQTPVSGKRKSTAASRMVDHWMNNQKSSPGGSSSPVHSVESSPSPSKKKLTIQTVVSDEPPPKVVQKTLSERFGRGVKVVPKKTKVTVPKLQVSKLQGEHTLKVKLPQGTTERSKKLIAKQKQAAAVVSKAKVIKKQSVFDRLGKEPPVKVTPPEEKKKSEIKTLKPLKTSITVQLKEQGQGSVFSRLGGMATPVAPATVQAVTPRIRLPSSDDEPGEIDYTSHSVLKPAKQLKGVTAKPVKPVKPVKRSVGLMSDADGKSVFARLGAKD